MIDVSPYGTTNKTECLCNSCVYIYKDYHKLKMIKWKDVNPKKSGHTKVYGLNIILCYILKFVHILLHFDFVLKMGKP